MTRWAGSETEATTRLLAVLDALAAFPGGQWAPGAQVRQVVPLWLADLDAGSLASSTRQLYAAAARRYLVPALGDLRLGELSPALLDRTLGQLRLSYGPQPARAARRALSSLCADAVRHAALAHNPVRDTRPIPCPRPQVRALTTLEAHDLQARLHADNEACRLDLPDLVQFMLGTGVRIGEAAAVRRAVLDLDAGTVHINATVVRVPGAGLQIQPRT